MLFHGAAPFLRPALSVQGVGLAGVFAWALRAGVRTSRPLRILHIVSGNSLAGVEQHVVQLAEAQRDEGFFVHIVHPPGGWLDEELRRRALPHTGLPLRGTLDARSLARLVRIAWRERATVVHGHLARGMFYAMALGKLIGLPSIGTDHMNHPNWVMGHLSRLIVPSRRLETARWKGIRPDRLAIVPHGVSAGRLESDPREVAAERARWGFPEGAPVVGMLGRLVDVKGHDILLKSLLLLDSPEEAPAPCAVFAGPEDREWGDVLRRQVRDLGLSERVRFLPARPDVGTFLAACDVIALPSRMEAFPLVLLEAMMLGRPVVATTVGGIPDMVADGRTGLLVPPEDPERLASALQRLLCDPGLRRRLGAEARAHALEHFSMEAMERALRTVYLEALRRPAVPQPAEVKP